MNSAGREASSGSQRVEYEHVERAVGPVTPRKPQVQPERVEGEPHTFNAERLCVAHEHADKLEPLWDVACNTGHYGFPCDVDGDGKDEFMIGYNLIGHDGKIIWSLDDKIKDHADAGIVEDNAKIGVACAVRIDTETEKQSR